jgi:hypothetical protein
MSKVPKLIQGVDYYIDPLTKKFVLTEDFLKRRGSCCKNGCRHCPYGFQKKAKQ